jgi:hypothetical protein
MRSVAATVSSRPSEPGFDKGHERLDLSPLKFFLYRFLKTLGETNPGCARRRRNKSRRQATARI